MDTEPKIVGRENRPHMNALVHRTFWVGTRRSDAIAVDDAIASNVVREARHFAGGRLVDRSEGTVIPAQRQGEAMEGARFGESRFVIYPTPNPNRGGHTQMGSRSRTSALPYESSAVAASPSRSTTCPGSRRSTG